MDRKILFFDIDGTIVGFKDGVAYIPDRLRKAIPLLQEKGHICMISSGRTHGYLNEDILDMGFSGFVLCNGAIVILNDEIIYSKCFPHDDVNQLISQMDRLECSYTLNTAREAYIPERFPQVREMLKQYLVPMDHLLDLEDPNELDVAKIEVQDCGEEACRWVRSLKNKGYTILEYSDSRSFEINMPGVSKGDAILKTLDLLNIPCSNSIAFGDGDNDIEMLQVVGRGIAMGNAADHIKKVADVVTESCIDDGITNELIRMGLLTEAELI